MPLIRLKVVKPGMRPSSSPKISSSSLPYCGSISFTRSRLSQIRPLAMASMTSMPLSLPISPSRHSLRSFGRPVSISM